jgi:hypothetical protein
MSLIVCRKCGGDHLTIKCGKNKVEETVLEQQQQQQQQQQHNSSVQKPYENILSKPDESILEENNNQEKLEYNKETRRHESRISYRVKVSELPNDITEDEMMELCNNWGYITKLRVINYDDTSVSYIDFNKEECADYFVEALHRTPFDHLILNVTRVESNI